MRRAIRIFLLVLIVPNLVLADAKSCSMYFNSKSSPAYVRSSQTFFERLSLAIQDLGRVVNFDIAQSREFAKKEREDRLTASETIRRHKSKYGNQFFFVSDIISRLDQVHFSGYRKMTTKNWEVDRIYVDRRNIPTLSQFKESYATVLSPELHLVLSRVIDEMTNQSKVRSWMIRLNEEVVRTMWEDNIRGIEPYLSPRVREMYLDIALSTRAVRYGFKIQENDLPFGVYTFSERAFFKNMLAEGRLFLDWSGLRLSNTATGERHGVRGHALAMTFLAENVPGFVELIKYIGRTKDQNHIWKYLFDNASVYRTPFYNTYWLDVFSEYLGIEY